MSGFVKKRTNPERVYGEPPIGAKNNVNLSYQTTSPFIPGSLAVYLSGDRLRNDDFISGVDNQSFTLVLNPNDPTRLSAPPQQDESFVVDYDRLIVCNK